MRRRIFPDHGPDRTPRHARIREHNELLAEAARNHRFEDDVPVPFLCECANEDCEEYVSLTLPEFDTLRETTVFTSPPHR